MAHTRKLFGTDGIRGKANHYPMTPEVMIALGRAIAKNFSNGESPKIVIGKDTRLSGYMLETALTSGLVSGGAQVFLVGPLPTPAIAQLTRSFNAHAGIMISASHNPAQDNGVKVFDSNGFKLEDLQEHKIEMLMQLDASPHKSSYGEKIGKAIRVDDARGRYIEYAKGTMEGDSFEGLKVVVDCANGAAYKVAPDIFSELGAKVIAINNIPDGNNINFKSGAMHLESLSKKVLEQKADIGIALDGDADRLVVVDHKGKKIDGDSLMGRLALELKEKGKLSKNTIVSTVMSNGALEKHLFLQGVKIVRAAVGDRYVIEQMRAQGYNFGAEQSGHIIFGDYSTTGDGIIAALQLMRAMKESKKSVRELCSSFTPHPQTLINVQVKEKKPIEQMQKVKDSIEKARKELSTSGRVLVRYSGTENICRVMVEGVQARRVRVFAAKIANAIKLEVGA
ncbi:MAG TPA: phosphoglucosamine mutase [archaeon]|nr:phosphoglucosamine mutase [archaeon]